MTVFRVLTEKLTLGAIIAFTLLAVTVGYSVLVTFLKSTKTRSWRGFWSHLLPPTTLAHPSARADIVFYFTQRVLKLAWAFPVALSAASIGVLIHRGIASAFGLSPHASNHATPLMLMAFTINIFISRDLSYYIYHRAQHANPYLWEFHKIHHSAERMAGIFTDSRVHPIDDLIYYAWDGMFSGVVFATWLLFISDPAVLIIFGVSATMLSFIAAFGYTHHLPYKLSFGWLDRVFVSPHYHQLHHSVNPIHYDRNFGTILIVWDRIFGSICEPIPDEDFVYGLLNNEANDYHSAWRLYTVPLIKLTQLIGRARHTTDNPPPEVDKLAT